MFNKKTFVFSSTENGEKAEKAEPEVEVKQEEPEETEEKTVKTKAKKDKKHAEEGFELWNELEVQRIKFMVSSPLLNYVAGHPVVHSLTCAVTTSILCFA